MATVTRKSSAPKGISLTRNGRKFAAKWKHADYKSQNYKIAVKSNGKWHEFGSGSTASKTDVSYTVPSNLWAKATEVRFTASGTQKSETKNVKKNGKTVETTYKYTKSDTASKSFGISAPNRPSITVTLDTDTENRATFAYSVKTDAKGHSPFDHVLIEHGGGTGDKAPTRWTKHSSPGASSGSVAITETAADASRSTWYRYVRIRAYGPGGKSEWRTVKAKYGDAATVTIGTCKVTETRADGTRFNVQFSVNKTGNTDKTEIQYALASPSSDPNSPQDASWKVGATYSGAGTSTGKSGSSTFTVDDTVGTDQFLYVRGVTYRNGVETFGNPKLLMTGKLSSPTLSNVVSDNSKVTFTASSNSSVPNAMIQCFARYVDSRGVVWIDDLGRMESGTQTFNFPDDGYERTFHVYAVLWYGGRGWATSDVVSWSTVANIPQSVAASYESAGRARIEWAWAANGEEVAEISWSQQRDAWDSTDEPDTYEVAATHAPSFIVAGLDEGETYFFRMRFGNMVDGNTVWGFYSEPIEVSLASAPNKPALMLADSAIAPGGWTTAFWAYSSTDGTQQGRAEIHRYDSAQQHTGIVATTTGAQSVEVDADALETGLQYLSVVTYSASGHTSEESDLVPITVAETPVIALTHSLTASTDDDGEPVYILDELPITATVTGGISANLSINRAESYQAPRPDEGTDDGYEGECVSSIDSADGAFSVDVDSLRGRLDDGAQYELVAIVTDGYGQTASETVPFTVAWNEQPAAPTVELWTDDSQRACAVIAHNPAANEGDTVDIYRLSLDRPQLIVSGGELMQVYVDPYPAAQGGYRCVTRSKTGDVVCADGTLAWVDTPNGFECLSVVVDFGDSQIELPLDLSLSNSWSKQFTRTRYLNGSETGDWGAGVERDLSVSTTVLTGDDSLQESMRRLAEYEGVCHIRTPEGSSFDADIQVSEDMSDSYKARYTLTVKRVDSDGRDGMTASEWTEGEDGGVAFWD